MKLGSCNFSATSYKVTAIYLIFNNSNLRLNSLYRELNFKLYTRFIISIYTFLLNFAFIKKDLVFSYNI